MQHSYAFWRRHEVLGFARSLLSPSVTALFMLFATGLILFLSVWYASQPHAASFSLMMGKHWRDLLVLLVAFLLGGFAFAGLGHRGWREVINTLKISFADVGGYVVAFLLLAVALIFWVVSEGATHSGSAESSKGIGYFIQHDPGGIFAVFMGFLTVAGFAFTLHDLRQIRRTITSFPDLIDRLCNMLDKDSNNEPAQIVCYTPSLGFIALSESDFERFSQSIRTPKGRKPRAEMICLHEKDLEEWHQLFVDRETRRGKVSPELATGATDAAKEIIEALNISVKEREGQKQRIREKGKIAVKRLPFDFMPGYYVFISRTRAIVVAPLNLPFPKGAPKDKQQSLPTVHMIGFETNDRGIINDLQNLYHSYRTLPSGFIAEVSEKVHADKFKSWAEGPEISKLMHALTLQFDSARGAGVELSRGKQACEHGEYTKYLGDGDKMKGARVEVLFRVMLHEEERESANAGNNA
jgi:hypothetical protein